MILLLYCYSKDNTETIRIKKLLTTHKNTVVLVGKYNDKSVIIKYYKSEKRDTTYEMSIYKRLDKMGCKLPWYSTKFLFMGSKVLVMEKLYKIDKHDDIYSMGKSVVSQLSYLHRFAIHNDIKPGNIMKRKNDSGSEDKYSYFLIDFGGVSTEKMKYGYRRWIWTASWTCQPRGQKDQISTPKHDFIELAYTLNYIHNKCDKEGFKEICPECLGKYYKYIRRLGKSDYHDIDYRHVAGLLKER